MNEAALPAEPIFSILTLLMGALRSTPSKPASLIYKSQFCLSLCTFMGFNSSETTGRTNIKLGMIDHHLGVSAIRSLTTS